MRRHPWVYDTAVERAAGNPKAGDTVKVVAKDGRFLAWASYSPASTLRARCWSFREDEVIDDIWFEKKIREAVAARDGLLERTNARRILFGEADGLPGLIVDQYGDWLVTQFQAAGVEAHRELIGRLLLEVTGAVVFMTVQMQLLAGVRVWKCALKCSLVKRRQTSLRSLKMA